MFQFFSFVFLAILFLSLHSNAQTANKLKNAFCTFKESPALQNALIGFCVTDVDKGKIIFAYDDSLSLTPASCLKIATTGAALGLLGPNYKFTTKIAYDGNIDSKGNLHGDIVIIGGGDPTFGSDRWGEYKSMAIDAELVYKRITFSGIKHVEGKLILDVTHFDNEFCCRSWACDDTGNYFGAGACGFNINENKYDLQVQAGGESGDEVKVLSYNPEQLHLNFKNCLITRGPHSGDQSNIFPGANDSSVILEGSVPASKSPFIIKGSIPDPPVFAAKYLAEKLHNSSLLGSEANWQVNNGCTEIHYESLKIIDSILSPELTDIVKYTNLNSINLYAECLVKEMGKIHNGLGTRRSGIEVVKKYWNDKGIDTTGLYMEDGCGLSIKDKISALQLCKMLAVTAKQSYFQKFLNSLPVAGRSGAMKGMGKGTEIEGKIFCKTGHITGIRGYSGYFKSKSGKWLCFTLMVNDYTCSSTEIHDAIEHLLIALSTVED